MLPWSIGLAVASWICGAHLIPRYGQRVMYGGLAVLILGVLAAIAAYHTADPMTYPWPLLGALAVAGLGIGGFTSSFFTAALRPVSAQETGSAAGLLNAVQQLGGTLGVAVIGSIYLTTAGLGGPVGALGAVQHAFWAATVVLLGAAAAATLMSPAPRPKHHATDSAARA